MKNEDHNGRMMNFCSSFFIYKRTLEWGAQTKVLITRLLFGFKYSWCVRFEGFKQTFKDCTFLYPLGQVMVNEMGSMANRTRYNLPSKGILEVNHCRIQNTKSGFISESIRDWFHAQNPKRMLFYIEVYWQLRIGTLMKYTKLSTNGKANRIRMYKT